MVLLVQGSSRNTKKRILKTYFLKTNLGRIPRFALGTQAPPRLTYFVLFFEYKERVFFSCFYAYFRLGKVKGRFVLQGFKSGKENASRLKQGIIPKLKMIKSKV